MKSMKKILIIEDDDSIRIGLEDNLKFEGYQVQSVQSGEDGLKLAQKPQWALIILDIMLPGIDGFEICRQLRKKDEYTPVMMLTAKDTQIDKIVGFEIGADDYVTKPFDSRVLLARVKALLRRINRLDNVRSPEMQFGEFILMPEKRVLQRIGHEIHLTPYEYGILFFFLKQPNQVIDRQTIIDVVWGEDIIVSSRTVDTHIAHLRQKIEADPANPKFIISVRNAGYRFDLNEDRS